MDPLCCSVARRVAVTACWQTGTMGASLFDPVAVERASVDAEFCSSDPRGVSTASFSVAGLFAGIGGIELGLQESGAETVLLCEWWEPAQSVLRERFDAPVVGDVQELERLPDVDLVTAGFPCADLSQAGRTKGITGEASGLVGEVFRLLRARSTPMLLLENVRNMLVLDNGEAMRFLVDELEALGYRWAYRLVDSRFTGVPQRRQRVIFLASQDLDPRAVLFADDAGEPDSDLYYKDDAYGFYWTEGLTGLGWARDAVPTIKGGSSIGIPSPPAIWNPSGERGRRVVTPRVHEAEELQGFPAGWTEPADSVSNRKGTRWKLVGNAVTVGVSRWVGERLVEPGEPSLDGYPLSRGDKWPVAACGANGKAWAVDVSLWPRREAYTHLSEMVDLEKGQRLSAQAAAGFFSRTQRASLNFIDEFLDDVAEHATLMADELAAV